MAQPNPAIPAPIPAAENAAQAQRGYRGPPERQRNRNTVNLHQPRARQQGRSAPQPAPNALPAPANRQSPQPASAAKDEPIRNSAFTTDFDVREDNPFLSSTPSMSTLIEVVDNMYLEYSVDNVRLGRTLLPEYLRYYATALAWLRITSIKDLQRQPLTPTEQNLLRITHTQIFTIPDPLNIYLKQYGTVIPPTDVHIQPAFPDLPTGVISGFGGYYGPLNNDTHLLYEEIPCLGVTAEAVRRSISDAPIGPYQSNLSTDVLIVTDNLLGFQPLGYRQTEAKAYPLRYGINPNAFRETLPHTAFNLPFLTWISGFLATQSTFKNHSTTVLSMGVGGHTSQLVNTRPLAEQQGPRLLDVECKAHTMFRESPLHTGLGLFIGSQIWKDPHEPTNWSCATSPEQEVPIEWVNNANDRRNNTPGEFLIDRFSSTTYMISDYIRQVIGRLVVTRR